MFYQLFTLLYLNIKRWGAYIGEVEECKFRMSEKENDPITSASANTLSAPTDLIFNVSFPCMNGIKNE